MQCLGGANIAKSALSGRMQHDARVAVPQKGEVTFGPYGSGFLDYGRCPASDCHRH